MLKANKVRALLGKYYDTAKIYSGVVDMIVEKLNEQRCSEVELLATIKWYWDNDYYPRVVPEAKSLCRYLQDVRSQHNVAPQNNNRANRTQLFALLENYGWDRTMADLRSTSNRELAMFAEGIGITPDGPRYSGIDSWYTEYLKLKHENGNPQSANNAASLTAPTEKLRLHYSKMAIMYTERPPWTEEQILGFRKLQKRKDGRGAQGTIGNILSPNFTGAHYE